MSSYSNFISDFPQRCEEILSRYFANAHKINREVTLLLSVATTGFVIPFERLRRQEKHSHPMGDRERFFQAALRLDKILDQNFLGSDFWPQDDYGSWSYSDRVENHTREPDSWPELRALKPLGSGRQAKKIVAHLRNSLAHGNIITRGNPIELLAFLSKPSEAPRFALLTVSPFDFYTFLMNWFAVLRELHIPSEIVDGEIAA